MVEDTEPRELVSALRDNRTGGIIVKVVNALYILTVGMIIFVAVVVFTPAAGAQTIHAILIIMNDAPLTQELNETNLVRVTSHLEAVKDELGCNLTVDSFRPSHTNSEHHATRENLSWEPQPGGTRTSVL